MARPAQTVLLVTPQIAADPDALALLLNLIQQTIAATASFLLGIPTNQGQSLIKSVALTTSATQVRHGLRRPVNGYMVVRNSANATFIDSDTATPNDTINL